MIIQHNMQAMNANRMLGTVVTSQSKSTEKLSSGYRINRAADDAAGLSISEKMRGQIRGLNQASTNAQDGISLIQTAEGALNESHAILQRMRELSVQAANGTETDDDREAVQNEITQLQDELTRIAETTEFNTMKLLDGSQDISTKEVSVKSSQAGAFSSVDGTAGSYALAALTAVSLTNGASNGKDGDDSLTYKLSYTDGDGVSKEINLTFKLEVDTTDAAAQTPTGIGYMVTEDGTKYAVGSGFKTGGTIAITELEAAVLNELKKNKDLTSTFNITSDGSGALTFVAKTTGKQEPAITHASVGTILDGTVGADANMTVTSKAATDDVTYLNTANQKAYTGALTENVEEHIFEVDGKKFLFATKAGIDALDKEKYSNVTIVETAGATATNAEAKEMANLISQRTGLKAYTAAATNNINTEGDGAFIAIKPALGSSKGISLQIGANEGQMMNFSIGDMSAKALGVDGEKIDLTTQDTAKVAMTTIDEAIKKVSAQRSQLGAVQNRLEHTISNVDTASENLQTAESRIRDVDMAKEMVTYSKNNILQQAAQSMLAQANQSTQGVLSLLQ